MNEYIMITPSTRCRRCGRALKSPDSIKIGLGPVCLQRFKEEFQGATQMPLFPDKVEILHVGPALE